MMAVGFGLVNMAIKKSKMIKRKKAAYDTLNTGEMDSIFSQ